MKIARRIGLICVCIAVFMLAALTFGSRGAFALSISDLEVQQAMLNGLYNCYNSGAIRNRVSLSSKDGYFTYDSKYSIVSGTGASVSLPTYFSGMRDTRQINCSELLFGAAGDLTTGSSEFPGIFKVNGISTPSNKTDLEGIDNFMTGMGYVKETSHDSGGKTCIGIYFTDSRKGDSNNIVTSDLICFTNLSDGKIAQDTEVTLIDNGIDYDHDPLNITLGSTGLFGSGSRTINVGIPSTKVNVAVGKTVYGSSSIANEILSIAASSYKGNGCKAKTWTDPGTGYGEERWTYCLAEKDGSRIFYDPGGVGMSTASYRIDDNNTAFNTARSYLKLPSTSGSYSLTQKFILYQSYLAQYYGLRVICGDVSDEDRAVITANGYTSPVYAYHEGKFQECLINIGNLKGNRKVVGFDGGHLGGPMSAEEVLASINNIRITSLSSEEASRIGKYGNGKADDGSIIVDPSKPGTDPVDPVTGEIDTTDATDVCYGSAGTLGMSWILCPILTWTSNGLNHIYGEIEQDYLRVDPSFVSTDNDTYKAWQTFQNAANIILAILLLVVIFSQLTGIGIDNYGIKKILPRLIICAILINLSYFIAQFFVDISNIVGSSVRSLFESIDPGTLGTSAEGVSMPSHILGITVFAAGAGWLVAAIANPAILLGLLLALISGLFAVLMMWLILIVRQAGVILAVIIAPVAFVLYLLPNTSKFTKSWWNLMKSLLLLYPLAGLLIGASFFISNLMVGNSEDPNPQMVLPAMIMRVAPFFALPALFRKSVDAMGSLGTRIQGIGRNLSRATTNAAKNADWYKNAQERGLERRTRIRAGINQDGTEATGWRGLLRSRSNRNRARYRQQYLKNQSEENKASLLNDPDYMDEMRFKQQLDLEGEQEEIKLMNDPNYRKSLKENQREALEKKKKDVQASMLKSGNYTYRDAAGVDQKVDPSNGNHLRAALISELSKGDGEISKINALYDAIRAKGDAGIDILGEVWDSGTINANTRNFAEFRDKIVSDGEIKSKARTLHSIAKAVQSGTAYGTAGNQVANARSAGTYVKDIAAEKVPDLTNNELSAFNARAQAGDTVAQETLYRTMANPELNSKVKGADRDNVLWSASQYLQNNFRQINHANDRTETWRDNTGRTRQVGITPEGLRYDKQSGANYGHALDIRQMNANWTRVS